MAELFTTDALVSFFTLTLMEIVLGVDNIIFISILTGKLPKEKQNSTRIIGLTFALVMRILLLMLIGWIVSLKCPLFELPFHIPGTHVNLDPSCGFDPNGHPVSGKDLILLFGGIFLVVKTIIELYHKIKDEPKPEPDASGVVKPRKLVSIPGTIAQIIFIDLIFSFDSILSAVGLVDDVRIMIAAVVASMIFMVFAAKYVSDFIERYPGVKIIALTFLVFIGAYLIFEGIHLEVINKVHLYIALGFALLCEWLRIRYARKHPML
ncbi:MAG: TerC family protein [Bacteroidia bacterium]|nr:TerC family protein [Bacteroidia bacterium]